MASTRRARPGTAGLLVIAASAGVLVVFGRRDGDPTRAFRNIGRMLLESRGIDGSGVPVFATALGALHHMVIALCWGVLLLLVARLFRGVGFAVAALLLSVAFVLLNLLVLPPIIGIGYSTITSVARAVPMALAVAVALLVTPWASGVPGPSIPSTSPA